MSIDSELYSQKESIVSLFDDTCGEATIIYKEISSLKKNETDPTVHISICPILPDGVTYVAAVGSNHCFIYELTERGEVHLLQEFIDDNENESFYVCEWMMVKSGDDYPQEYYLAVGGALGQIKILDCVKQCVNATLVGHLGAIQALKSCCHLPYTLLSGSADNTLRVWDIRKKSLSSIVTLPDGFSLINSIDIDLQCKNVLCSSQSGAVCVYEFKNETGFLNVCYTKTGQNMPVYWVGKLVIGFVNGNCTLFKPFRQVTNDNESGSVIKIIKQYSLPSTPTSFCVNRDASLLACLCMNTVAIYRIDIDIEPYTSFVISDYNSLPRTIAFCRSDNSILVDNGNSYIIFSPQQIRQENVVTCNNQLTFPFFEDSEVPPEYSQNIEFPFIDE